MDKDSNGSVAPFLQTLEEKVSRYRPVAKELLSHLPNLQKLEQRLRRAVSGEVYSRDLAEEVRSTKILLEELDDILFHAEPPKETKFKEAVAKATALLQQVRGNIPLSGETRKVTLTSLGWEQLNYKWNMILDIPVEFVDGDELEEDFTDALDDARDGLIGHVWSTDGTESEECESTYEVDRDTGEDA